jgi:death-on-curing protein
MLMQFGKDLTATQDEKYSFVIEVASGQIEFNEIVAWIKKRVTEK